MREEHNHTHVIKTTAVLNNDDLICRKNNYVEENVKPYGEVGFVYVLKYGEFVIKLNRLGSKTFC